MINLHLNTTPPSLNSAYKKYKNRIVLSQAVRELKQLLADSVSDNFNGLNGRLELNVTFMFADRRKRDVDNYLKVLLDSMKGKYFHDDDQIYSIRATKQIGCEEPKTIITINSM